MSPILTLCLILAPLAFIVGWKLRGPSLTPLQRVFADAENHVRTHGLCRNNFTPVGYPGVGDLTLPHDLTSVVAIHDPAYDPKQSMYQLDSVKHLRYVSFIMYDMAPEDVGDQLDLNCALELLSQARTVPQAVEG